VKQCKILIEFNAWYRQHCARGVLLERGMQRGETKFCFLSPGYDQIEVSMAIAGLSNWLLRADESEYGQLSRIP